MTMPRTRLPTPALLAPSDEPAKARWRRLCLPGVLVAVGFWLLSGCIYIPTGEKTTRGTNASARVGAARSSQPIRLKMTNRDEVLRILGQPAHASQDRSQLTYTWHVQNGVWVWPLCFFLGPDGMTHPQSGRKALTLTFDEGGVLREATVPKTWPPAERRQ